MISARLAVAFVAAMPPRMRPKLILAKMAAFLLLSCGVVWSAEPTAPGKSPTADQSGSPSAGRPMAKYVPVGPVLVFGPPSDPVRKIRLLADHSPRSLAEPAKAFYGMEPPMIPRPAPGTPRLPQLPWVSRVGVRADGRVTIRGKFVLFDRELAHHAQTFLEVADAESLGRQAVEKNGGKPLRVVVEPLDLTDVSVALSWRNDPARVLAFGEAKVTHAADTVEIDLAVALNGGLAEILEAAGQGELLYSPRFSYVGKQTATARLLNAAELKTAERLKTFLQRKNVAGDGTIDARDVDEFGREMAQHAVSLIRADDPRAAALLVNNITAMTQSMFSRAGGAAYATYVQTKPEYTAYVAHGLKPLGTVVKDGKTALELKEKREGKTSGVSGQAGVAFPAGPVMVGLGFGVSAEQMQQAAERLGVTMTWDKSVEGWVPGQVTLYRAVTNADAVAATQTAEVVIAVGDDAGTWGSPFTQEFNADVIKAACKATPELAAARSRASEWAAHRGAARAGLKSVKTQVAGTEALIRGGAEKAAALRAAATLRGSKHDALSAAVGTSAGYTDAGKACYDQHGPVGDIDQEEAAWTWDYYRKDVIAAKTEGWQAAVAKARDELATAEAKLSAAGDDDSAERAKVPAALRTAGRSLTDAAADYPAAVLRAATAAARPHARAELEALAAARGKAAGRVRELGEKWQKGLALAADDEARRGDLLTARLKAADGLAGLEARVAAIELGTALYVIKAKGFDKEEAESIEKWMVDGEKPRYAGKGLVPSPLVKAKADLAAARAAAAKIGPTDRAVREAEDQYKRTLETLLVLGADLVAALDELAAADEALDRAVARELADAVR